MLLFIVACATSLSYALTYTDDPQQIAELLVSGRTGKGSQLFLLLTIVILVILAPFWSGALALIIFGADSENRSPFSLVSAAHFRHRMIMAMGFGLFFHRLSDSVLYTTLPFAAWR